MRGLIPYWVSPLGLFNMFLAQWFFVRLCRVEDAYSTPDVSWTWLRWVVPLTGWYTKYWWWPKKVIP